MLKKLSQMFPTLVFDCYSTTEHELYHHWRIQGGKEELIEEMLENIQREEVEKHYLKEGEESAFNASEVELRAMEDAAKAIVNKTASPATASTTPTQIETGYMIGGRTWISDAWNDGSLTKESVETTMREFTDEKIESDDDLRARLRTNEMPYAQEEFENSDGETPLEEILEAWVEREFHRIRNEESFRESVAQAMEDLLEEWTDDKNDEEQFERVYRAHSALDEYCRKLQYGDFDWM